MMPLDSLPEPFDHFMRLNCVRKVRKYEKYLKLLQEKPEAEK